MRVSELVALQVKDVVLGKSPYVKVTGKGRKERSIPIDRELAKSLSRWKCEISDHSNAHFFPSIHGKQMSPDAVQHLLKKYLQVAKKSNPSLEKKKISPHSLRHTTAMNLLNRGVDIQIIALWLGHDQIDTTQIYLSESLALKRKALKKTRLMPKIPASFKGPSVLRFL